jgi:hypothetical protein
MATQTAPLTHCPTCGVKLERPELSMCAYCASPLRVGPVEVPNDETQKRLAKVKSHAEFAQAQRWIPLDPILDAKARKFSSAAIAALVIALLVLAISGLRLRSLEPLTPYAVGLALLFTGLVLLVLSARVRALHRRAPMLKRAGYVLDRRSETNQQGGVGSTTYVFKIRFEDGSEGEFSHIGRGSMYDPPANGAAGVVYTRGARMLEFRRL